MQTALNPDKAKELFLFHTGGTGRVDTLRGNYRQDARVAIMTALNGVSVSKRTAAFHFLRRSMIELYGASGNCDAAIDADLALRAKFPQKTWNSESNQWE